MRRCGWNFNALYYWLTDMFSENLEQSLKVKLFHWPLAKTLFHGSIEFISVIMGTNSSEEFSCTILSNGCQVLKVVWTGKGL